MDLVDILVPLWNRKTLSPPPFGSFSIISENPAQTSLELANILENVLSVLEKEDVLKKEAVLMNRLLYRTRRLFRNAKGYKGFRKVQRTIENYSSLGMISVVTEVRNSSYGIKGPSKGMMEWLLISFQRFASLFDRLQSTCVDAACHLFLHLKTGNLWQSAIMFLACLSRIWTISRYWLIKISQPYLKLKQFMPFLHSSDCWLPIDYNLPEDIPSWIGNPDYLKGNKTEEDVNPSCLSKQEKVSQSLLFNEDLGEIISRDEIWSNKVLASDKKLVVKKPEDIMMFLANEKKLRSTAKSIKRAYTKDLNEEVWNHLYKFLEDCFHNMKKTKDRKIFYSSLEDAQRKIDSWINSDG